LAELFDHAFMTEGRVTGCGSLAIKSIKRSVINIGGSTCPQCLKSGVSLIQRFYLYADVSTKQMHYAWQAGVRRSRIFTAQSAVALPIRCDAICSLASLMLPVFCTSAIFISNVSPRTLAAPILGLKMLLHCLACPPLSNHAKCVFLFGIPIHIVAKTAFFSTDFA
jgi:hypothetical protein